MRLRDPPNYQHPYKAFGRGRHPGAVSRSFQMKTGRKTAQKWGSPSPFQAPYHHSKAASENPSLPVPGAGFRGRSVLFTSVDFDTEASWSGYAVIDEDGNEIDAYGNVIGKLTQEKGL
ncbi:hypothetical protein B0H14DRAFT_2658969 [Mycena olivaceomarginata]|nr:hypothetical protein B0H14DRAFT_2658969 [Mycena olivaceomarginata]